MSIIYCLESEDKFRNIGNKARNLAIMFQSGFTVPDFFVVEGESCDIEIMNAIEKFLPDAYRFSVRSCSVAEDEEQYSYAGQFETFLNLKRKEVTDAVKKVRESKESKSLTAYEKHNTSAFSGKADLSVIVERMIDADISGVMFTQNPTGLISETVISFGQGPGSCVSDDAPALVTYYYNKPDKMAYSTGNTDILPGKEIIRELMDSAGKLEKIFGEGLDIEFAIKNGKIYFLQVRKITTIGKQKCIILDNSNIVESFPGISSPLTQSFASEVYKGIFESLIIRLSSARQAGRMKTTLKNMVMACNGRIYYNTQSWYRVLKLLPFSKKIIPVWQEMLGIDKTGAFDDISNPDVFTKIKVTISFINLVIFTPAKMKELNRCFAEAQKHYHEFIRKDLTFEELFELYEYLHDEVLAKWDITLANDMYSFLATAVYKKVIKISGKSESDVNRSIAGIQSIESLRPLKSILNLADIYMHEGKSKTYKKEFYKYLKAFGDRSTGELKLETLTFREAPELLQNEILNFTKLEDIQGYIRKLKKNANPGKKPGMLKKTVMNSIAAREKSRMNRSRLFGFARRIFKRMGTVLEENGCLEKKEDVFWLSLEELQMSHGKKNLKKTVSERKKRYKAFETLPAYRQLVFAGRVTDKPTAASMGSIDKTDTDCLFGIPCSQGVATAEAVIVKDPNIEVKTEGKIIVAQSTDPGWVFLMAGAAGIITEKGSLLSHTSIVARELNIPSVTGVEGAVTVIKNGDRLLMDCETGIVRIMKRKD